MPKKEKKLPVNEQTISVVLGFIFVLIIGWLLYRYLSKQPKEELPPEIEQIAQTTEEKPQEKKGVVLPTKYTVQAGDNLWKIAERFYQSGYNWVDIVKENNLKNPNILTVGQELSIPDVQPRKPTVITREKIGPSISPGKYTVQRGDWLSKIALRAYGDMFAWEKIYEANKDIIGPNPNLIKPGQVLTIPE